MSALVSRRDPATGGAGNASVWDVPGSWARTFHGWKRALAQLRVPPSARAVLDAVEELYSGVDAVRARDGVPLTVRTIAARYGIHPTHVQRGLAWGLAHRLLARRRDEGRPGCFLYALTHPSCWRPTPLSGHGLARASVPGWDAPLLDVTVDAQARARELSTGPTDNPPEGVHTERHASRARSSPQDQREENSRSIQGDSSLSKTDCWYVWSGSGSRRVRVAVTWWIAEQLETRWPIAFEVLAGKGPDAAPSWLVAELHETLAATSEVRWTIPMVRTAVARAVEAWATINSDRAERARLDRERSSMRQARKVSRLLGTWRELAEFARLAGDEYAERAPRAAAALEAGDYAEIDVFEVYLEAIGEARDNEMAQVRAVRESERVAEEEARSLTEAREAEHRRMASERVAIAEGDTVAQALANELAATGGGVLMDNGGRGLRAFAEVGLRVARAHAEELLAKRGAADAVAWLEEGRRAVDSLALWRVRAGGVRTKGGAGASASKTVVAPPCASDRLAVNLGAPQGGLLIRRTTTTSFILLLVIGAGCASEYQIIPTFPLEADVICRASSEGEFVPSGAGYLDRWAGRSVAIASSGTAASTVDLYRWMVTGAPGSETNEEVGYVRFTSASPSSGTLDTTSASNIKFTPPAPFTSSAYQYGWSLESADFRDCHPGAGVNKYDGCGQEVLVGAPDTFTHTNAGRVFWYEPDGDGNVMWQYGGTLAPPAGTPVGSEFGYAIAAAFEPSDAATPWEVGDTTTRWVAISAPDADKVFVYGINPTLSSAFVIPPQTLTAPIGARRFGHSLTVGDFDDDGIFDLAVGAPIDNGADKVGRVWVYRGQSNTTSPFLRSTPFELDGRLVSGSSSYGAEVNHFGWSLAAGRFVGDHPGDALLVGAPLTGSDDDGGYCQYVLDTDGASPSGLKILSSYQKCTDNTWVSATAAGVQEHMGYSVAVGNFQNGDSTTAEDTTGALLEEVAIGRPGAKYGASSEVGFVDVMLTDGDGFEWNLFASVIEQYVGPTAGARFGEAIASGYVQETHWEDLTIGAPEVTVYSNTNGSASLTKATPDAACNDIDGYYLAEDAWTAGLGDTDGPETVKVFNDANAGGVAMVFVEDFWLALKTGEAVCTVDGEEGWIMLPAGTRVNLTGMWGCSDTTKTWTDVDVSALIYAMTGWNVNVSNEVTLTLDTTTGELDYAIVLDGAAVDSALALAGYDEACEPDPLSGTMTLDSAGVCE